MALSNKIVLALSLFTFDRAQADYMRNIYFDDDTCGPASLVRSKLLVEGVCYMGEYNQNTSDWSETPSHQVGNLTLSSYEGPDCSTTPTTSNFAVNECTLYGGKYYEMYLEYDVPAKASLAVQSYYSDSSCTTKIGSNVPTEIDYCYPDYTGLGASMDKISHKATCGDNFTEVVSQNPGCADNDVKESETFEACKCIKCDYCESDTWMRFDCGGCDNKPSMNIDAAHHNGGAAALAALFLSAVACLSL
jgi:hypothetical protein